MTSWTLRLLLVVLLAAASGALDLGQARSEAMAGDRAYEAGDYAGAAQHYRAAVEAGLDHAEVHFNLGNAYYKQGDLGLAIAAYERVLLRAPRHAAARGNLERARQQTRDEVFEPLGLPLFLRPLGWIYERVALNEWAVMALIGLLLAALSAGLGHWWSPWRRRGRGLVLAGLVIGVCALSLAGLHTLRDHRRTRAVVTIEEAEVRSGPGSSYNLSFKVHAGLTVFVSERREDWILIHLGGQLVGWVPAAQIEII